MNQTTRERKKQTKGEEEEEDVQQQHQQHSGIAHELTVGDRDGEPVAQVREEGISYKFTEQNKDHITNSIKIQFFSLFS